MCEYRIFVAIIAMPSIDTLVNALLELVVLTSCQAVPIQWFQGCSKCFCIFAACSNHE